METTNWIVIQAVSLCRKYGFNHTRDVLWAWWELGKISTTQILHCFNVLHIKGF